MKRKFAFFALLLLLLVACSSTNSSPPSGNTPNILKAVRPVNIYGEHYPAFTRTVTNAAAVQQLYRAAYGLPGLFQGKVNCPAGFGLTYHLTFLSGTTVVQAMDLEADGCQYLNINQTDVCRTTPSFRALVAKTLNIPSLIPMTSRNYSGIDVVAMELYQLEGYAVSFI